MLGTDIVAPSVRAYFEANRNIHRANVELARNRFLLDMFNMIWGKAQVFPLFATIEQVDLSNSLGDHTSSVDVIASGDRAEALETFINHIQDGFELQVQGLKASENATEQSTIRLLRLVLQISLAQHRLNSPVLLFTVFVSISGEQFYLSLGSIVTICLLGPILATALHQYSGQMQVFL